MCDHFGEAVLKIGRLFGLNLDNNLTLFKITTFRTSFSEERYSFENSKNVFKGICQKIFLLKSIRLLHESELLQIPINQSQILELFCQENKKEKAQRMFMIIFFFLQTSLKYFVEILPYR